MLSEDKNLEMTINMIMVKSYPKVITKITNLKLTKIFSPIT